MQSERSKSFLLHILLWFALTGMTLTISQYLTFNKEIGFLNYKQDLIDNKFWLFVFYIHVFTCFVCLLAGFTQFSTHFSKTKPKLHRFFGRIYFYNIVFINFPAGITLSFYANGHIPGKIAFISLACLWFYFTIKAIYHIKKADINGHRKFMIRSYSLTLSAITLRFCKLIFGNLSNWSYDTIYILDAWTALILNLIIAELIIYFQTYRSNLKLIANK